MLCLHSCRGYPTTESPRISKLPDMGNVARIFCRASSIQLPQEVSLGYSRHGLQASTCREFARPPLLVFFIHSLTWRS